MPSRIGAKEELRTHAGELLLLPPPCVSTVSVHELLELLYVIPCYYLNIELMHIEPHKGKGLRLEGDKGITMIKINYEFVAIIRTEISDDARATDKSAAGWGGCALGF